MEKRSGSVDADWPQEPDQSTDQEEAEKEQQPSDSDDPSKGK